MCSNFFCPFCSMQHIEIPCAWFVQGYVGIFGPSNQMNFAVILASSAIAAINDDKQPNPKTNPRQQYRGDIFLSQPLYCRVGFWSIVQGFHHSRSMGFVVFLRMKINPVRHLQHSLPSETCTFLLQYSPTPTHGLVQFACYIITTGLNQSMECLCSQNCLTHGFHFLWWYFVSNSTRYLEVHLSFSFFLQ